MYADDLASGIRKLSEATQALNIAPGIKDKVLKSLAVAKRRAEGEIAPKQMKKGKKVKDGNVAVQNIVQGKRVEVKFQFKVGDGVSVKAEEFDGKKPGSFSKDNPGRQLGVVVNIWPEK